jgi:hypothetical protein
MICSINYDKQEIKLNFDASKTDELPIGWGQNDLIKTSGSDDYERLKAKYKIIA